LVRQLDSAVDILDDPRIEISFGKYTMRTHVDFQMGSSEVKYSTRLCKLGISVFRSEKIFYLDPDGQDLRIEGREYYWPLSWMALSFEPLQGFVETSGTMARYQMPIAGIPCDCKVILEPSMGLIAIETSWMRGAFSLSDESLAILQSLFIKS
jgi:hypothetical protein